MNKLKNKNGFSIIELIITVSIIILLTVIGISSKRGFDENSNNAKIISDTKTLNNALLNYKQENSTLPMPDGNVNFFSSDTSYVHSYEDNETFGVYGSITQNTLPKKYIDVIPLDPRTNSYYSYGKTKVSNEYEIASIQIIDASPISKVEGNYTAENGPYNLIREYNGPNFVYNGSETNFPYNPDEFVLIATDKNGNIYREGDTVTTGAGEEKEIFFSDGSVSLIKENSNLTLTKLSFKGKDNLNTLVKLGLTTGEIWTKATKLNSSSEFEIYTSDSSAAVRGTIFGVIKNSTTIDTQTIVIEGEVEIKTNETTNSSTSIIETITVKKGENIKKVETNENIKIGETVEESDNNDTYRKLDFSINKEIRTIEPVLTQSGSKDDSCNSFVADGQCMDGENKIIDNHNWKIVAYAPFNDFLINTSDIANGFKKSFYMYGSGKVLYEQSNQVMYGDANRWSPKYIDGLLETPSGGCQINCNLTNNSFEFNNYNHIMKYNGVKGVYIDNNGSDSYLKYDLSNINLNLDLAIEMNVRLPNVTGLENDRYMFKLGEYGLYIKNNLEIKSYFNENKTQPHIDTYFDGNFHKIIAIKKGNNYSLKIDGNNIGTTYEGGNLTQNILYIGTNHNTLSTYSTYTNQFSDIIDYVKIYTKNPSGEQDDD